MFRKESHAGKSVKTAAKIFLCLGAVICIAGIVYSIVSYHVSASKIYISGYEARMTYAETWQLTVQLKGQLMSSLNLYLFAGALLPPIAALFYAAGVVLERTLEKRRLPDEE